LAQMATFIRTNSVMLLSDKVDSLDDFVESQHPDAARGSKAALFDQNHGSECTVEYDGPAQQNASYDPFLLTRTTLFNNVELYNQLLHWYFGGKSYQITKAIRLTYD